VLGKFAIFHTVTILILQYLVGFFFRISFCLLLAIQSICNANVEKRASIVIDYNSKKVLFAGHPDEKRYPASLTKIMTIYLLLEAIKAKKITPNTKFKTSKFASQQIPSKLGLKVGEKISVLNIMKALTVKSANDAAVVAAEGLAGTVKNFCVLMNRKAKQLGMKNTHFENPAGTPNPKQKSTAMDLVKLGMATYRDFPQYWKLFSEKTFLHKGKQCNTHCKILLWYKWADGAKTGYINDSGFNLFVTARRSKNGSEKRIFVVVMGEKSGKIRDLRAARLMDQYLGNCDVSPKQPKLESAKKSLMAQVGKSEMLDQLVHEEESILVSNVVKSSNVTADYLADLYQVDDEIIEAEEELLVKQVKKTAKKLMDGKNLKKRKSRSRRK
jgi:D-alanyl-D-alanine carboxypeptidase